MSFSDLMSGIFQELAILEPTPLFSTVTTRHSVYKEIPGPEISYLAKHGRSLHNTFRKSQMVHLLIDGMN